MIDRRYAPAGRIRVLAWRTRQLVGRGSAPAEKVLRGARPLLFCSGDETRQRAEQAKVTMAPAALLSLVALRRAVQGRSASANATLFSVQGLGFALFGHISAR